MSTPVRYNSIAIDIYPNPQYLQHRSADHDISVQPGVDNMGTISLKGNQIKELHIVKSHDTHLTDVKLMLIGISHTTASTLSEGKYVVKLTIEAVVGKGDSQPHINYFLCENLKVTGETLVAGTYPTLEVTVNLKSILRYRLEIENNFAFELGGKGGNTPTGSGTPIYFLYNDLLKKFTSNYSPEDAYGESANTTMIDIGMTSDDPNIFITDSPKSGYKMEADTNLQVLDFFFEHYPLFATPYGWVIDDFNTQTLPESRTSVLSIKDFLRYDAWQTNHNFGLTELISGSKKKPTFLINTPNTTEFKADGDIMPVAEAMGLFNYHISHRASYYNSARYMFRDDMPLIFAQNISDGQPIDMSSWNAKAKDAFVLTSSAGGLRVKSMPNPMYRHYLTFLSPLQIGKMQKFRSIIFNLHPELITHEFENLHVGDVDIHHSHYMPRESMTKAEDYGYDKYGVGYHVKHIYSQVNVNPATHETDKAAADASEVVFEPKFLLKTSYTALTVDAGPVTIADYDSLDRMYSTTQGKEVTDNPMAFLNVDPCATHNGIDLGGLATAEPGSSGNETVAAAAKTMIDRGFRYLWGGASANAMDCSAFTMYAVRNGGADAGRTKKYPNGTSQQITWLKDPRNGAELVIGKENIRAGDIVFFHTSRGNWGHTGIARDNSSYYEAASPGKKGANVGSFKRVPSYIFRLHPMTK